jgi:hypothetical protein
MTDLTNLTIEEKYNMLLSAVKEAIKPNLPYDSLAMANLKRIYSFLESEEGEYNGTR